MTISRATANGSGIDFLQDTAMNSTLTEIGGDFWMCVVDPKKLLVEAFFQGLASLPKTPHNAATVIGSSGIFVLSPSGKGELLVNGSSLDPGNKLYT